jgi:hypothetical protein
MIVLLFLFDISLQQAVQINGGLCVCQVMAEGRNQWWTMNGWNANKCNQYQNRQAVSMGTFTLFSCVWKPNRPIYAFKSLKNGKWCSADNYGEGPLVCNRDKAQ